jgi:hypothetical protein
MCCKCVDCYLVNLLHRLDTEVAHRQYFRIEMTDGDTGKDAGDARRGAATRAMGGRALSRYTRTPGRHRCGTA